MSEYKKLCATCGSEFTGKHCTCQKSKETSGWAKFACEVCGRPAFQPINNKVLCGDCYCPEYEKSYKCTATPEQIARFLIKAGSKSIFWQKATEGQRQYAMNYYKAGHYKPENKGDNSGLSKLGDLIG
jgi:hypothetical protein